MVRMPCGNEGRDEDGAGAAKEHQTLQENHHNLGERPGTHPSLTVSYKTPILATS